MRKKKKSIHIWDGNVRDAALSILLAVDQESSIFQPIIKSNNQ